ncbi:FliM/FliN family flagellar motor C-terminal domain-containing protein [Achromobacter xylosoxidans]|uniref:FliM/FliN family flagellar motor C-terminal domain-containing protein n=1 Tax=Alcaligenes xylosoxydans xylosoxydans TaxID=85698 RepID=UPI0006BF99DF|nr:FliM/FliN family flagellar motor C-terminal domain-containing protein [Achromobacter xylosoxidans]CUJ95570.1 Flagellar motor switch protein [Achromobacter xylosoxidans]
MATWTIAWWTQAERDRAASNVRLALCDWARQWGAEESVVGVGDGAVSPGEAAVTGWLRLTGSGDQDGVWLTHPDAAARVLSGALYDDGRDPDTLTRHGGPVSQAVARQAARALAASLRAHFDWAAADDDLASALPEGLLRGGMALSVAVAGATLMLVCGAGVARGIAGRRPGALEAPLVPLPQVIGRRPVTLTVALRPVRLDIGSLCSLAAGDVIALDHKLDEPVALLAGDASPVADANLARIGPQKAIRFERAAP